MNFFNILFAILLIFLGIIVAGYGFYEPQQKYSQYQRLHYPFGGPRSHLPYEQVKKEKKLRDNYIKGLSGENIVLNHLNTLPKNYLVFHDVQLPNGKGNIDHIVVGQTGLFIIETKNYSGKYLISGNRWYYYKDNKYNEIKQNPGTQLMRNILYLKSFLEEKGIKKSRIYAKGIVAFVQNNVSITRESENYKVLSPSAIPEYILTYRITDDEKLLAKIAMELEPHCTELTYVPKD